MRIAFLGKGGSGKTTLSSLMIRIAPEYFDEVFAIDADINRHLAGALHRDGQAADFSEIYKKYDAELRRRRPELASLKSLPRTLPPWDKTSLLDIRRDDSPWRSLEKQQPFLAELGSYNENNMGWSCHHSSLGKLQLVLAHTADDDDRLIIVDLTAGADVFGVGMLGLFDKIFVAVEPTLKSTNIFNQLKDLAEIDDVELTPVANKVIDQTDLEFIQRKIGFKPQYVVGMSNFIRRLERDEPVENHDIEAPTRQMLNQILSNLKNVQHDEYKILQSSIKAHRRAAANWPKDKFAIDLLDLINPELVREA